MNSNYPKLFKNLVRKLHPCTPVVRLVIFVVTVVVMVLLVVADHIIFICGQ